jgi:hypothetical protein
MQTDDYVHVNGNMVKPRTSNVDGNSNLCSSASEFCKQMLAGVLELIYWRDVRKSGVVFGATLVFLLCLATMSVISVVAYIGLMVLAATVTLRVAKLVMEKMGKDGGKVNEVQAYIESHALQLPRERVHQQVDILLEHVNHMGDTLRRLLLIEDYIETVKFGALLWALTYVGQWFSGMTLVILLFIGAFTVPKFYEVYREPIDQYLDIAQTHIKKVTDQVNDKLPFLKKKQQ